ncbi:amino acid adenylation domain-containing protein [Mycobacterium sp.]|uniref:amino acid adenylation domain-containing protein n=2 Tax=Mycobacterium sp. TaxID=1785 RepID=UPI003F96FA51
MPEDTAFTARTVLDLVRHRAERYRDKLAFDYCRHSPAGEEHSRLTYHELDIKARAIASTLQRQGAAGERVLVLCPSGLDFVAGFFGCLYAGAIAVPVHPPVRSRVIGRVASIVADTQARFALTTAELRAELKAVVDGLPDGSSLQWCAADAVPRAAAAEWVEPDVDPSTTAFLQYTSGSTSSPKGVVVTHGNLLHNLEAIHGAWERGDDNAIGVFWLPLHHDMGLIGGVLETLYVGCTSFFMPPEAFIERPMRWLEAISRHGATITAAPNFAYELCIQHSSEEERAALDLSNWSTALCGAEPVRTATLQRFTNAFAVAGFRPETFHPVYGLAEATLLVSGGSNSTVPVVRHVDGIALREHRVVQVAPEHPAATPFVGCGRVQHGQDIVIVDPAARRPSRAGEVGEIWLAGGSVARGYWRKPAETVETFSAFLSDTGRGSSDTGRGPFLRTGDLGFRLDGELFVTGRLKDLIIIRGRNYYPEDIEATAQDSHPALLRGRGAAFSVTPAAGSAEQLVVVQEVDRNRIREVDIGEAIDAIRASISEHHGIQPHAVVLVEPSRIPTTSSGKIRHSRCRERFLDGALEVFAEWRQPPASDPQPATLPDNALPDNSAPGRAGQRAEEIAAWFVSQLSSELGLLPTEIETSVQFANYGLDSVHAIRLTAALQTWLGRELSPTLAYEYPTIDLISEFLAQDRAEDTPAEDRLADGRTAAAAETVGAKAESVDEPIAIVGIGCRFPAADGPAAFWRLLADGVDAITEISPDRWGAQAFYRPDVTTTATRLGGFLDQVDQFDPEFFGISPRESARMDPQQRLLLEVAWEALEDAGQVPERLEGSRTGVFIGISTNEYGHLQFGRLADVDAYSGTGAALSIAANRLSYLYDFRGPSMAVDTACSSSLVAIHLACRSLREGDCTLALAGGANVILSPGLSINFSKAGVMAADGRCKTFDARADGYVRGEGAGIVVLKPLSQALADGDPIYAVIRGSAINQDGRTNGLMAPSRQSQEAVLAEAYRRADLSPGVVEYVEAHGSGTSLGDAIEAKALGTVLAEGRAPGSRCLIGSVKTNIGHLEAAAGVAGLIKVALALRHRMIPPSVNFTEPNPNIRFDSLPLRVANTLTPWPETGGRAVAGVSAFGFGGANAHVVLTEAPETRVTQPGDDAEDRVELLPLSARSPEALAALAGRYEEALTAGAPLADLCYTAGARRGHHDHRLAVVGGSPAELSESLAAYRQGLPDPGLSSGHCRPSQRPGVVFVFSGQGSQWFGMGQRLYAQEPAFRDALDMCDHTMRPHLDRSVLAELPADDADGADDGDSWLGDIGVIQPAIFAVQVALAALWRSWGVEPAAVIGHSLGEVAAAHVAGALSLEDAAQVICARARVLRRARGQGAMLAAELSLAEAQELIAGQQGRVVVAAINSHRSMVMSGDPAVLAGLMTKLEHQGRFCRWVKVDVASHGPQMDPLRAELKDALAGLRPAAGGIPMYSTVTCDLLADGPLDDAYWVENLCSPVRFSAALRRLINLGHDTFLEVSPHPILLSAVREDAEDIGRDCTLLLSMCRDDGGRATLLRSLGTLYTRGQPVAWEQLRPRGGRCVAAPTYPWQRRRFWPDTTTASDAVARQATSSGRLPWRGPLRSSVDPQTVFCEIDIGTELMPDLTDHRVNGSVVLPAAVLIKLALSAAAVAFGEAGRLLRDVVFHRTLTLTDAQPRTVQVVLRGDPLGTVFFECHTPDIGTPGPPGSPGYPGSSGWLLLASGTVATCEPNAADAERHVPEEIRNDCPDGIPARSFYHLLADHGLQYGPGFQAVEEIRRRDGEAIARLTPPGPGGSTADHDNTADHDDTADHDFNAQVLDCCFQVLAATLPARTGTAGGTYLLVGVAELRSQETSHGGVWCHAVLRPVPDPEPNIVEGDVFLLREDGQVVLSVRGLRLQRVAGDTPAKQASDLHDRIYELRWQLATQTPPDDAPSRPVEAGSWLIFSDGSATSDILRDHLERHSQTCVLVEPGTAFASIGPGAYRLDPKQPQHFRRLLDEAFAANRPPCRGVAHLWSLLAAAPGETSTESLESARVLGTLSVLHLAQALTLIDWPDTPRLWLVTRGAQAAGAALAPVSIAQAPLWGMGRSIEHEHPELRCSRVDLSTDGGPEELRGLFDRLWADGPEPDVALRGSLRYVARLARHDNTVHPLRPPAPAQPPAPGTPFRMVYPAPGVLDDIRAWAAIRRVPRSDEVEIRVHAAGLNFMDVMRALGVYPGQVDGPVRVGIECAGTVTAVGDGVDEFRVGDAVIALAMDGVGSFVTTPACLVAVMPAQLSFQAAASLPIAYLTAYYALHEQARLRRGERVLIHSAAGGVGLAAVQVARWLGATAYATAGTPEKRDHLRALGVEHVWNSRSPGFADAVLSATGGEGVDVVLNSLTGEAIAESLTVLRPFGRFLEIGKRDVYGHGRLRLWQLRQNASYMVVDLAQLVIVRPDYVGALLRRIVACVGQGALQPVPVRTFAVGQTAAAVRCLAQGKQIGKVVVSLDDGAPPLVHPADAPVGLVADATYLITGGLGGLGRAVATWMVDQGARHLVLMGRGPASESALATLDALRAAGSEVVVAGGNVASADEVAAVLGSIRASMPPLRGVVHAAGILDDGIIARLDGSRLRDVMAPKVEGAWNLHALTRDAALDFFVLFSSAASVLGSPGQAHYAAANAFLDALAWHRRAEGRPALSIDWGPWAGVGFATQPEQLRHLIEHGVEPMPAADGVQALSHLLRGSATQVTVLRANWAQWRSPGVDPPLLAHLGPESLDETPATGGALAPGAHLNDEVRRADPAERQRLLESYLRDQAAGKLGLAPSRLDIKLPLNHLGVDSLIATELRTQIERDLGIVVPVIVLLNGPTITQLAARLGDRLDGVDPARPDPTPAADTRETPPDKPQADVSASVHPLSYGQRSLWFLHKLAPASPAYTITYAGRITGDVDASALERAAQALVEGHPILRTTYAVHDGQPVQLVHPRWPVRIARHDVGPDEPQLHEWLRRESNRPFDLQTGPVLRLSLLRRTPSEHVLVLVVHHIAVDFWSIDVILDELRLLYAAEHGSDPPPPCPERYVDYVDWQIQMLSGAEGERLWNYWRRQLSGDIPSVQLPIDRPRPAAQTYRGAVHRFTLDGRLGTWVREVGRSAGTTPYMTFLAAYATLLHRYGGQDDLPIGSPFGCRDRPGLEGLVGYIANPVVLRADLHGDPTFTSLLGRVKDTVLAALAHSDYPFALLVERLRPARDLSHTPLFQVSFAWEQPRRFQDGPGGTAAAGSPGTLDLSTIHIGQGGAPLDLMMQVADSDGQFTCELQYNTDIFDQATIERMAGHFVTLLGAIATDADRRLSELPVLTEAERLEQAAWNETRVRYEAPDCVHEMVAKTAQRRPDAIAVWFDDREMTYTELDRRADALAHRLQRLRVGLHSIVAVLLDRSEDLVVALLGVLKAGGAFMPLDPAQPTNRIAAMMTDAGVPVCVTHQRHLQRLQGFSGHRLCLDAPSTPMAEDAVAAVVGTTSASPAYVIHTSGSTGVPKAAINTHAGIRNYLLWMQATYRLTVDDRVLHHTPVTFDASVAEIFLPLIVGAQLVIAKPEGHKDPAYLVRTIAEQSVTQVVHFVPSILRAFLAEPTVTACVGLRRVSCGGEVLPYELTQRFLAMLDAELWNEYGPAETAITATAFHCKAGAFGPPVPIGRPLANVRVHLLDGHLRPVPVGVPGELFIGGVGVGGGYLNQPDPTAARFIADPFADEPTELLYRTGDLARYLPEGNIEYLGRLDDQVEIHGVRIEPSEIEAALDKHPRVRENAVIAGNDGRGNTRLVAYVVAPGEPAPTTAELRRFLLDWLPAAMVPAVFCVTEALPRTSSGKVDRRALAAGDEAASVQEPTFVAPRTHAEKILTEIWRQVLEVERVGVHDDFFALGGCSTHSLEVTVKANEAGLPLKPKSVFLFSTVAELAAEYRQAAEDAPDLGDTTERVNGSQVITSRAAKECLAELDPVVPVHTNGQEPRNTVIESIGAYLPADVVSTENVLAGCANDIGIPLERLTGIKHRRVAGHGEFSIDLARQAAVDCLARSSYGPDEIDLVISCNISRYDGPGHKFVFEPSTAARLRDQCGLANALAFDITNACAGMFTGITVADAFLKTGLVQRVMVVSGEYITHLTDTAQKEIAGPMDARLACLTLGDAGAAVILERGANGRVGFHDIDLATLSRYSSLCVAKATNGPHGGAIMLCDSIAATAAAVKRCVPYVTAVMTRHGWRPEHCDHIVMHQTSEASLNDAVFAVNRMFGHTVAHPGNIISNLAERGNTASTTHFVALSDHIRGNRIQSGDNVVFGISGSGQTVGAALYTFDDLPDRLRRGSNGHRGGRRSTGLRSTERPVTHRVRIEGAGTAQAEQSGPRRAVDLAVQAATACLDHSGLDRASLGLIIHAGVYRDDFICEPAIAALVAGELGVNDDLESPDDPKTLAFDVLNGALGFLNACHVATQMIGAGKAEHAMVVASEVENNTADSGRPLYGIAETGSAVILGRTDGTTGFGQFVFHHHPEYGRALSTYVQHRDGQSWLQIDRDPNLEAHYLDTIPAAVEELLKLEGLGRSEIALVFPPYLSAAGRAELAARIGIPSSRFVDVAAEADLFTSSVPYALEHAWRHTRLSSGDVGLIVSVGSGLQVGCTTYRF